MVADNARSSYVLIHGFNGSSETTWLHEKPKPKFFWPKQLEVDLKESRVFLYGYDAALRLSLQKNSISISSLAESLFAALIDERADTNRRPIVFVAHSLGGLVLKRAILDMHQSVHSRETLTSSEKLAQELYESISGLIFFGTPHLGSRIDEQNRVKNLKGLIGSFATIPKNLTKALESESVELGDLSKFFEKTRLYTDGKVSIRSFHETITRALYGTEVTTKASANLHYANEEMVPIERTHEGMVKFASPDDQYYKATLAVMRRYGQEGLKKKSEQDHPPVNPSSDIPGYPLISMMPVKTFVQRTSLREQIREQLNRSLSEEMKGETRKVGVWGLGGAGKSQLARSYLQRYRADYNATFWIQAGQTTSIDRDFLQIYHLLSNSPSKINSPSAEQVLRAVHTWFASRGGRWLFVFDGADQLENENDPYFVDISQYIPGSPNIHVILTSRSPIAKALSTFEGVNVCELEEAQAMELFSKCSEIAITQQKTANEVKDIVKELGNLALAITLSGSYISQTPRLSSNLPAYLEDYYRRRQEILSEQPNKLIHQYGESVMTVWEMSYSAVENQLPEACRFLTLLAFLNYEDIFLGLFDLETNATLLRSELSWTSVIGEKDKVSVRMIDKCFAILENHSLLQRQENEATYSMHKLVHAWGSDRHIQEEKWQTENAFCIGAFQLLFEAVFSCVNTPEAKLRLVPHLRENFNAIQNLRILPEISIDVLLDELEYVGGFLCDIGRLQEAAAMQQEVLSKRQQILGDEHPDTIMAMSNLAVTLCYEGKHDEAAAVQQEVLKKRQQILGNKHPDTILAMSNFAVTLRNQGKLNEAAAMQQEVLKKSQQILGDEHPDTIKAMSNLAGTLRDRGKRDEAAAVQQEVLKKSQQILGDEHPDTIKAMSNLAITLCDQGKLNETVAMQQEVLKKMQRILGNEHPNTIMAMSNLAITLSAQGKLNEAVAVRHEMLKKMQQIFGDEHPYTIMSMSNLAVTLYEQGKHSEAAAMQQVVLKKLQQTLSDKHPGTISAMSNLALTLRDQGKLDEAAAMQQEVLKKMQQILGDEHPGTITAVNNLTIMLRKLDLANDKTDSLPQNQAKQRQCC